MNQDIQLPANYTVRPVSLSDLEPVVQLFNTCSQALQGRDTDSVEDTDIFWRNGGLNLAEDTRLVLNPEGEPVAYVEFWDIRKPHVHKFIWACVHPAYQGRGLGTALAGWAETRARGRVELAPQGARVILTQGALDQDRAAEAFLRARGYQYVRSYYRMLIELTPDLPQPVLPQGITIHTLQPGEERAVFQAVAEGFRDHWGHVDEPFEELYARRMKEISNDPRFDPSLWFLAREDGQIAGVSLCSDSLPEDPGMGWLGQLTVLRPWRKRGLGLALLHHTFNEFARRGKQRVALGVDASSLTGAVGLYERAGMHVAMKFNNFEIELRPGEELGTEIV